MKSFALTSNVFVQSFDLRDDLLHFFKICLVLKVEIDYYLASNSLYMVDGCSWFHFVPIFFHLCKFSKIFYLQKTLHYLIVQKLGNRHQIVEKICQYSHPLLYMPLSFFSWFFLRNRGNNLSWIHFLQMISQPGKITVSPSHTPIHL